MEKYFRIDGTRNVTKIVLVMAFLCGSFGFSSTASADDESAVKIVGMTFEGGGCPEGAVSSIDLEDATAATIALDEMTVSVGMNAADDRQRTCRIKFDIAYPGGWTPAKASVSMYGYARNSANVTGMVQVAYSSLESSTLSHDIAIDGPYDGEFTEEREIDIGRQASAPCADHGSLMIEMTMNLASNDATASGEAVLDLMNIQLVAGESGKPPHCKTNTIGLYDPQASIFYLRNVNNGGFADIVAGYGPTAMDWIPVVGDWDGDGVQTLGLYDPVHSIFFLRNSNSAGFADVVVPYGAPGAGWIPVVGDWDGDGVDTIGLFDPAKSIFYLRNSNTGGFADLVVPYGPAGKGWLPVVGDWNGDGVDTVGAYDPAASVFYLRNSNSGGFADIVVPFGPPGKSWIPIAADWNGDGLDSIGLFDPTASIFYLRNTNTAGFAELTVPYGPAGGHWKPVVGAWK